MPSFTASSAAPTSPTAAPSSSTVSFPSGLLEPISTSAIVTSSSLPSVSSSDALVSMSSSQTTSSTHDVHLSQSSLSDSFAFDTSIEVQSQQSLSTTSSQSFTITPSSSALRDDFTRRAMSARYPIFRVQGGATVPATLKISDDAIRCSSSLYQQINWWVTDAWYNEICIEGALAWFNLLQSTSTNSGVASPETLLSIAQCLLETAIYCAGLGRMVHPGVAGGLSISSSHQSNADDELATSSIDHRYGLSIIQPATRQRYAKELVKVFVYLNNACMRNHGRAMLRADLDNADVAVGAGYIFQVLFDMEWPTEPHPFQLGTLAQVAAASCLEDLRRPDERADAPSLNDLRLVPAARLASAVAMINDNETFNDINQG